MTTNKLFRGSVGFEYAMNGVLNFEKGFQQWHEDAGNWTSGTVGHGKLIGTNWGITAPELVEYLGRDVTVEDMKNLKKEDAVDIYWRKYWTPIRGEEIHDKKKAKQIVDMAINAGVGTGIKLAHRAAGLPDSTKMTDELLNHLNNPQ